MKRIDTAPCHDILLGSIRWKTKPLNIGLQLLRPHGWPVGAWGQIQIPNELLQCCGAVYRYQWRRSDGRQRRMLRRQRRKVKGHGILLPLFGGRRSANSENTHCEQKNCDDGTSLIHVITPVVQIGSEV